MTALIVILMAILVTYVMIGGYAAGLVGRHLQGDVDRELGEVLTRVFWPIVGVVWAAYMFVTWVGKKPYELGYSYPERKSARAAKKDPSVALIGRIVE